MVSKIMKIHPDIPSNRNAARAEMLQWIFFYWLTVSALDWLTGLHLCIPQICSTLDVSYLLFLTGQFLSSPRSLVAMSHFFHIFQHLACFLLTKATFQLLYLREIGSLTTMSYVHHSCSLLILCLICHTEAEHWHDVQASELQLCDCSLGTNVINQNNSNKLWDNLAVLI